MEADLSRWHHIDVRDRWRRLPDGSRALTLRMISVRVAHLPPESAVQTELRGGAPSWGLTDVLLAHLWQAITRSKKPHPLLARATKKARKRNRMTPAREARRRDAIRRQRARRERFAKGEAA